MFEKIKAITVNFVQKKCFKFKKRKIKCRKKKLISKIIIIISRNNFYSKNDILKVSKYSKKNCNYFELNIYNERDPIILYEQKTNF